MCEACDPKGRAVIQDRSRLCRACDTAAGLIVYRMKGGQLDPWDAAHLETVERGAPALRRIGRGCVLRPEAAAAVSMFDALERVALGPRRPSRRRQA